MIRTGHVFTAARAQATAASLHGSRLVISDEQGADLATIPTTRWSALADQAVMEATAPVTVERSGEAAAFRLEQGDAVLLTGDIPADMTLDRRGLLKGGTIAVDQFIIDN